MLTRQSVLHNWLNNLFGNSTFELRPITGDASFRHYFRLHHHHHNHDATTQIVMDTSRQKESLPDFIKIANMLSNAGVKTPEILAFNLDKGFALLEDFGDTLLLHEISSDYAHQHYERALNTLLTIQSCPISTPALPVFDHAFIQQELELFSAWFLSRFLAITLNPTEQKIITEALSYIATEQSKQPLCFIHRDYHSRNLALLGPKQDAQIGVFDFQDAMRGPFTYDLVSLLKDAYIEWPRSTRRLWLTYFYDNLPNQHGFSRDAFEYQFDLCGLQRHLKILGIFCRLNERDGKPQYLTDIPRTLNYILQLEPKEKALIPFYDIMQTRIAPLFHKKKEQR